MTGHIRGAREWLDRAPKGRKETGVWWRRHDEYDKRTVERRALAGERIARAIGAVLIGAGTFLVAQAGGLL